MIDRRICATTVWVALAAALLARFFRPTLPSLEGDFQVEFHSCPSPRLLLGTRRPIVLRKCIDPEGVSDLALWSKIDEGLKVSKLNVKHQNEDGRFLYCDKTRRWSDEILCNHSTGNQAMDLNDLLSKVGLLGSSVGQEPFPTKTPGPFRYTTWRLPPRLRAALAPGVVPSLSSVLPKDISDDFLRSFEEGSSWNLWLASPGSFASPHYDLESNLIVQLVGRKKIIIAPAETIFDPVAAPMYPSTHPHWRHLVPPSSDEKRGCATGCMLGPHATTVDLDPGDALFLPPYYLHGTEPSSTVTASLNVWFGASSTQKVEASLRSVPLTLDSRSTSSQVLEAAAAISNIGVECEGENVLKEVAQRCSKEHGERKSTWSRKSAADGKAPSHQFAAPVAAISTIIKGWWCSACLSCSRFWVGLPPLPPSPSAFITNC